MVVETSRQIGTHRVYVAMTRGRQRNTAMAVTRDGVSKTKDGQELANPQNAADPAPGTNPS